jgi:hypothetical protein
LEHHAIGGDGGGSEVGWDLMPFVAGGRHVEEMENLVVYGWYKGEHVGRKKGVYSTDSACNVLYTCWKLEHESMLTFIYWHLSGDVCARPRAAVSVLEEFCHVL